MASAEYELIGVWGEAPSGLQGQSPWSGAKPLVRESGGEAPLKLKAF